MENEDFVYEYDNIYEKLQDLYNETTEPELKVEIGGFIDILRENHGMKRDEIEEALEEDAEREAQFLNEQYERSRL